jgi:hypothetical protein
MSEPKRGKGRPEGRLYTHRLMVFLDDARHEALDARAKALSVSKARLVRDLVDEGMKKWRRGAE